MGALVLIMALNRDVNMQRVDARTSRPAVVRTSCVARRPHMIRNNQIFRGR